MLYQIFTLYEVNTGVGVKMPEAALLGGLRSWQGTVASLYPNKHVIGAGAKSDS